MTEWAPTSFLAHLVDFAGFRYDPEQDILYTRHDAMQRQFGYAYGYDTSAPLISADIDCEPIFFDHAGKHWMIELWKGQYGLETGCEIGIYNRPIDNPPVYYAALDAAVGGRPPDPQHGYYYACASDDEMLVMSSRLHHREYGELFHRGPERHWWLTGFKWGVLSDPDDLTMDVTVDLPDPGMHDAFTAALTAMGYTFRTSTTAVSFQFGRPKTPYQPRMDNPEVRRAVLAANAAIVATYRAADLPSNDPNTIPDALAAEIEGVVAGRAADLVGQLLSTALRDAGKTAEAVVDILGHGLRVAVDEIESWLTGAGYTVAEWFDSLTHLVGDLLSVDESCTVQIVNVDHDGRRAPTMRLVDKSARGGSTWTIRPPTVIRPKQRPRFHLSDPKGWQHAGDGSDGDVTYVYLDADGSERRARFAFACPAVFWSDNAASSSDPNFTRYARSGSDRSWHREVPTGEHPLNVAFVWAGGPAPT